MSKEVIQLNDIYILFQILSPVRLLQNIDESYLCSYSRSLVVIHLKYSSVYMSIPKSLTVPPYNLPSLVTLSSFSKLMSLFLFCQLVHLYHFRFCI